MCLSSLPDLAAHQNRGAGLQMCAFACPGGHSQLSSAGSSGLSDFLSGMGPQGSSPSAPVPKTDLLGRALSATKQDSFDFIGVRDHVHVFPAESNRERFRCNLPQWLVHNRRCLCHTACLPCYVFHVMAFPDLLTVLGLLCCGLWRVAIFVGN